MRVAALALYPVKGATGIPVAAMQLDELGPVGDRRYCLIRTGGRAFTQRDDASLARMHAALLGDRLALSFDGEALEVGPEDFAAAADVQVWSRSARARIAAARVNAALTRWFGTPLLLAQLGHGLQRNGAALAFGDAAALLVTNAASLVALNAALQAPIGMNRFRPNIVVGDAVAYAEDGWRTLRVGAAVLEFVHACGRCEVTGIDQEFGAPPGDEPLHTLSRLRLQDGEAVFGVRYSVRQPGRVCVGDRVEPLA